jgi:hypothetical protein
MVSLKPTWRGLALPVAGLWVSPRVTTSPGVSCDSGELIPNPVLTLALLLLVPFSSQFAHVLGSGAHSRFSLKPNPNRAFLPSKPIRTPTLLFLHFRTLTFATIFSLQIAQSSSPPLEIGFLSGEYLKVACRGILPEECLESFHLDYCQQSLGQLLPTLRLEAAS